jgi:anhydro-N-acetylmuramic acid kinase
VIEDFRVRDVAAGGQGAPLVPIADALLFGRKGRARALQNIGGMANLTVVPELGNTSGVRAFDTGPGVALIDALVNALTGERYDRDGMYAGMGKPVTAVLDGLLAHEYFHREPPKTTGRESFSDRFALDLLSECRRVSPDCADADVIATATELTARSIIAAYERFVPEPVADIVLSGGGAKNAYLVARIRELMRAHDPSIEIRQFDEEFFPGEAKEAVAFAFLGYLHLRGEPGSVATATGARGARMLGKRIPA